MVDPADKERLRRLEERLASAKGEPKGKHHAEEHYSQAQLAWRMVTELVAGLMLGFGIGYGLDAFFGTAPFLMVIFLLLGFAAGVRTMLRSAAEVQARSANGTDAGAGPAGQRREDEGD